MLYVKRNERKEIVSVSKSEGNGFSEAVSRDSQELVEFLGGPIENGSALNSTDQGMIRVLEDLIVVLIEKGVILLTELPGSAQSKILTRERLRGRLTNRLDLLDDD